MVACSALYLLDASDCHKSLCTKCSMVSQLFLSSSLKSNSKSFSEYSHVLGRPSAVRFGKELGISNCVIDRASFAELDMTLLSPSSIMEQLISFPHPVCHDIYACHCPTWWLWLCFFVSDGILSIAQDFIYSKFRHVCFSSNKGNGTWYSSFYS